MGLNPPSAFGFPLTQVDKWWASKTYTGKIFSIFLLLLLYLNGLIPGKIFPEDAAGRCFSIEANAGGIPDTDDTSDVIPGDSGERSFAAMHCGSWPRFSL